MHGVKAIFNSQLSLINAIYVNENSPNGLSSFISKIVGRFGLRSKYIDYHEKIAPGLFSVYKQA